MPLITRGLSLTAWMAKLSKVTRLSLTGICVVGKSRVEPIISTFTAVESKRIQPLKSGLSALPVTSIEPVSRPWKRAVPLGMKGLSTARGKRIISKSRLNGSAMVLSLRLPVTVMVFTPSTISADDARTTPPGEVVSPSSALKSATR